MSAQHTTGPWNRGFGNYVYQGEHQAPGQRLIAVLEPTTRTREDWDETFANAKLIAAAPDLLAALQGMVDIAADSRGVAGYHLNGEIAEWDEFPEWQAACAALAKATD